MSLPDASIITTVDHIDGPRSVIPRGIWRANRESTADYGKFKRMALAQDGLMVAHVPEHGSSLSQPDIGLGRQGLADREEGARRALEGQAGRWVCIAGSLKKRDGTLPGLRDCNIVTVTPSPFRHTFIVN